MISVDIRRKGFGGRQILRDIALEMGERDAVAILGPSGIGKSTLLRLIAGLDTDFEGTISRPVRIGMVFQEPVLLPWRSAFENLTLVHSGLDREGALEWLARVGISDGAGLFPGQLSLGQQRRLALARALAGEPELLIMDEPFASLDEETADEMITLTQTLIADTGPALVLVTHSEVEARRLARRVLRLGGSPATLVQDGASVC